MSSRQQTRGAAKAQLVMETRLLPGSGRPVAAQETPRVWTGDQVQERLSAAMKAITAAVPALGPKSYGSSMPQVQIQPLSNMEMIEQMNDPTLYLIDRRVRIGTRSHDISLAEEAIHWPGTYLVRTGWTGPNNVLRLWMQSVVARKSLSKLVRQHGMGKAHFRIALNHAFDLIAKGLANDGVPVK